MKKLLKTLIIVLIIYFLTSFLVYNYSKGKTSYYKINNYSIKEIFTNFNKEKSNYYFDITVDDKIYNLKIYNSFKKQTHIIKSIDYYKGNNYTCIIPTFIDGKLYSDYKCLKNGIIYNYNDIKGHDEKLDKQITQVVFNNKKSNTEKQNFIKAYIDNNDDNHTMLLTTYKGYCLLNKKFKCYNIFENDSYSQDLRIVTDDYYLVADYNDKYDFYKFYYYNFKKNKRGIIQMVSRISFNSFIQGYEGNKVYLVDKESREQYIIDIDRQTVKIKCSEVEKCKILGIDEKINMYKIVDDEIKFNVDKINRLGNSEVGFTYVNIDGTYYKVDQQNTNIKTYAFKANDFIMQEENIYYVKGNYIYLYNPNKIDKPIIYSKELISNNKLLFSVK